MSKNISSSRTIRELAPAEMEQVGGGLVVKAGPVTISQKLGVPTGYTIKRVTGLAAVLIKKV